MRPRSGLIKTCTWRSVVLQKHIRNCIAFEWKAPQRAYKNYVWRSVVRKSILKLLFLNKTPQRAYKNYGLEIRRGLRQSRCLEVNRAQKHIKTCCFWMRPRSGLTKTMLWRSVVRQKHIKTCLFLNETPQRAYKNYGLEISGACKSILKLIAFWTQAWKLVATPKPWALGWQYKKRLWKAVVRMWIGLQQFRQEPSLAGLQKLWFGDQSCAKALLRLVVVQWDPADGLPKTMLWRSVVRKGILKLDPVWITRPAACLHKNYGLEIRRGLQSQ